MRVLICFLFFFFNDTATTEIYTLSLHDALPIFMRLPFPLLLWAILCGPSAAARSEEHTSELQSRSDLVCRLLLEKKKHMHRPPINFFSPHCFVPILLPCSFC